MLSNNLPYEDRGTVQLDAQPATEHMHAAATVPAKKASAHWGSCTLPTTSLAGTVAEILHSRSGAQPAMDRMAIAPTGPTGCWSSCEL